MEKIRQKKAGSSIFRRLKALFCKGLSEVLEFKIQRRVLKTSCKLTISF